MTETETHHATTGTEHDVGHGHAPGGVPLGPIDVAAWAYALAGSVLGLLVVLALYVARGG